MRAFASKNPKKNIVLFLSLPFISLTCYAITFPVLPSNTTVPQPAKQQNKDISALVTYLQNLGQYFGYDLNQYCQTGGPCATSGAKGAYSNALINESSSATVQLNLFNSELGALLGGGTEGAMNFNPLVPKDAQTYAALNSLAGLTFTNPPYSSPSTSGVAASPLVDQPLNGNYLGDPVSQSLLNLLATPGMSFCQYNSDASSTCKILYREKVLVNVIGELKKTPQAFSAAINADVISQLNSNVLIAPLLYTTSNSDTSNSQQDDSKSGGLTASSQAQQAANFVRYAINGVNPLQMPSSQEYDTIIGKALNFSGDVSSEDQINATVTLSNYFTRLRTFTAQMSVPISNIYHILSQRLPQKPASGSDKPSSNALNEFIMATWRLYSPTDANSGSGSQQQWLNRINKASQSTVQKEMAILLAEINYQLYLTRMQQERILLTESIMLLQHSQAMYPRPNIGSSTNQKLKSPTVNSTEVGPAS